MAPTDKSYQLTWFSDCARVSESGGTYLASRPKVSEWLSHTLGADPSIPRVAALSSVFYHPLPNQGASHFEPRLMPTAGYNVPDPDSRCPCEGATSPTDDSRLTHAAEYPPVEVRAPHAGRQMAHRYAVGAGWGPAGNGGGRALPTGVGRIESVSLC